MRIKFTLVAAMLVSALHVPVYAQSGTADLGAAGWRAIQDSDGEAAHELFARALALNPNDAVLHLGAGAAAHLLGQNTEATRSLQRALTIDPSLTIASKLLAEIAFLGGDLDLAIDTYEQALTYAPDNGELSSRLDRLTTELVRRQSAARFTVTVAGPRDDALTARATKALDTAYWRVARLVGAYPSEAIVIELDTSRPFRDMVSTPAWNLTLFDGRMVVNADGAARDLDAFDRVLTHELTHAMVASMAPTGVPGWFHEGLAQLVEPADVALAERRLRAGGGIPWSALNDVHAREAGDAQIHNDISLLVVRALLNRIGGRSTVLLDDLADGQPLDVALAQFGFSYADLQADVANYLR
jgi:tetratricopeptide (TPR) repeat protein